MERAALLTCVTMLAAMCEGHNWDGGSLPSDGANAFLGGDAGITSKSDRQRLGDEPHFLKEGQLPSRTDVFGEGFLQARSVFPSNLKSEVRSRDQRARDPIWTELEERAAQGLEFNSVFSNDGTGEAKLEARALNLPHRPLSDQSRVGILDSGSSTPNADFTDFNQVLSDSLKKGGAPARGGLSGERRVGGNLGTKDSFAASGRQGRDRSEPSVPHGDPYAPLFTDNELADNALSSTESDLFGRQNAFSGSSDKVLSAVTSQGLDAANPFTSISNRLLAENNYVSRVNEADPDTSFVVRQESLFSGDSGSFSDKKGLANGKVLNAVTSGSKFVPSNNGLVLPPSKAFSAQAFQTRPAENVVSQFSGGSAFLSSGVTGDSKDLFSSNLKTDSTGKRSSGDRQLSKLDGSLSDELRSVRGRGWDLTGSVRRERNTGTVPAISRWSASRGTSNRGTKSKGRHNRGFW